MDIEAVYKDDMARVAVGFRRYNTEREQSSEEEEEEEEEEPCFYQLQARLVANCKMPWLAEVQEGQLESRDEEMEILERVEVEEAR